MALTLVIGNKNYSSWSLRPWLAMKMAGIDFGELRIPLDRPDTKASILRHSPTGRVPCLIDEGAAGRLVVWDSLAICEHVNEAHAGGRLWPGELTARARARSVAAEMHSGFAALRSHMSMDIRARKFERGAAAMAREDVAADITRIRALWFDALLQSSGPFLFGEFSIADAFYAPVAMRFVTYGVELAPVLAAYRDRVIALAPMQQWIADATAELEDLGEH
ncbi:MAG: glutathione S-transferase family protein [Burkholderiales bacterium]|jgi:glutathione S-transferase|nr:glutathione S-transferase family protein [Burkholderiales bacterium]